MWLMNGFVAAAHISWLLALAWPLGLDGGWRVARCYFVSRDDTCDIVSARPAQSQRSKTKMHLAQ